MTRPWRRTALVTGGATGIGATITARLLAEGFNVYVVQRTEHEARIGEKVFRDCADADRVRVGAHDLAQDGCATAVMECYGSFNGLDVLVNNAGVTGEAAVGALDSFDDERIDLVLDTNLKAPLRLTREALPHLSRDGGVVVNIGSTAGVLAQAQAAAYVASKAGLAGLTRALACDLGERGIRVVCIAPGDVVTATSRTDSFLATRAAASFRKRSPLGRSAQAEDVANAVIWAVSEDAAYITGSTIFVDGGSTAY
ncbi:SDR family NAD(P)-dependent oxidoreductase [Qaidamihabitans albus]|uniref:SDR family NAD(P)-dependent oxidoreductase n=1 Tax=Qaidamihabitans albus TaxID=2795733 RepID=UPI001F28D4B1|nr:SDR family oxidoreductase [Qaidamihabitans albus]